ncbi:hypothetical protein EVAR_88781_1 [Eumeta japonica]|uniref:Uncharacterized protein n=1 Tax=Eumeta variegata TaxID=151549 RepID=A0A4C1XW28_EUMVA|nr:hypothetical protein EVAR_88781_1 [Eumeta japonica]
MVCTLLRFTKEEDPIPAEHRPTDDRRGGTQTRTPMNSSGISHRRKRGRRAADPSSENYLKHLLPKTRTRFTVRAGPPRNGPPKGDQLPPGSIGVLSPTRRRPDMRQQISPPSRTCTRKKGVEDPRMNEPLRFDWLKFDPHIVHESRCLIDGAKKNRNNRMNRRKPTGEECERAATDHRSRPSFAGAATKRA